MAAAEGASERAGPAGGEAEASGEGGREGALSEKRTTATDADARSLARLRFDGEFGKADDERWTLARTLAQ